MCLQRKTICSVCGKDTDGLMTCTHADGEQIHLCPDCLEKDGHHCLRCGYFDASLIDGYCSCCLREIYDENLPESKADDLECESEFDDDELNENEIW